jgi:hypothetical protein
MYPPLLGSEDANRIWEVSEQLISAAFRTA